MVVADKVEMDPGYELVDLPTSYNPEDFSGGANFELVESTCRPGHYIWVKGQYGYCKDFIRNGRAFLTCRLSKQAKCSGRAVVDLMDKPVAKMRETKPHVCGQSAVHKWGGRSTTPRKNSRRWRKKVYPVD